MREAVNIQSHIRYDNAVLGVGRCLCICCNNHHSDSPPVNLLITLPEPAHSWHLFPRGRPIQIHNHIVLGDQKLQCADDIPAAGKLH